MKIGIVGAGLIGRKRAKALPKNVKIKLICDVNEKLAAEFANEFNCSYTTNFHSIIKDNEIKAVIISTPNGFLADLALQVLQSGKHVLIEKPGGRDKEEIKQIWKQFKRSPRVVFFGYNHRFHPAIQKAKLIIDSNKFGPVLFLRAKYGHGGRVGYEKEWRFNKNLSGGGELIDQGSHLIDLTNYFVGELPKIKSTIKTFFWKTKLEDTAFFIMENSKNQSAELSVSCVEWKNLFSFEIMLKKAKIQIDGLGGSYGIEKLTIYEMKPEMGPPNVKEIIFEQPDQSWSKENKVFFKRIKKKDYSEEPLKQAFYVLDTIDKIYMENDL